LHGDLVATLFYPSGHVNVEVDIVLGLLANDIVRKA